MNGVQKGGVAETPQTDIKNDTDRNRSFSDHYPFEVYSEDEEVDEHIFRDMMKVGKFHYISGERGSGKTYLMVNLMKMLIEGFDDCGDDWEIITNIFFYHKDRNGKITVGTPERIHHVDSLEEILMKMDVLSQNNRRIAIFIDSMDRFYTDDGTDIVSSNIRKLIINRKKMSVMLFLTSICDYSNFEYGRNKATSNDYGWLKSGDREWRQYLEEVEIDLDWNYLQSTYIEPLSYEVYTPTVDWTDIEKESGWYCDYEGGSVVKCSKDLNRFWKGLDNVSSMSVSSYLHDFLTKKMESAQALDQQEDHERSKVLFAVKLKSIGLTDEAIEYLMGVPKTTLRRHADKLGYGWKVGYIESPFRFKRTRDDDGETSE